MGSRVQHPSSQRCRITQRRDQLLTIEGLKARVAGAGRLALWTTWGREPQRVSPAGQATRPRRPRLAEERHTISKHRDWLKNDTPFQSTATG